MAENKTFDGFTAEERAAMKDHAKEMKKAARAGKAAEKAAEAERDLVAKIAEMDGSDRAMAERLHEVVKTVAPSLAPRLYYGMPAYAKDGKVLCFFQPATKFKTRYATFGFNDGALLDEGAMWPTAYALAEWNADVEEQITKLLTKAVG